MDAYHEPVQRFTWKAYRQGLIINEFDRDNYPSYFILNLNSGKLYFVDPTAERFLELYELAESYSEEDGIQIHLELLELYAERSQLTSNHVPWYRPSMRQHLGITLSIQEWLGPRGIIIDPNLVGSTA